MTGRNVLLQAITRGIENAHAEQGKENELTQPYMSYL
jgi:hypothetical protein